MIGTHDALELIYAEAFRAYKSATRLAKLCSVSTGHVSFLLKRGEPVVSVYLLIKLCASNTFYHKQHRLVTVCNVYFDNSNGSDGICVCGLQLFRTIFVANVFYEKEDDTLRKTFAIRPLRCNVDR